jgi:ATP synthase protein I
MSNPSSETTPESAGGPAPYSAEAADKQLLRIPILAVSITGVIATILAWILAGPQGLYAALIGTIVVVGFFGGGQYAVTRVLRNNPAIAMNAALLVYLVQMVVMFGLIVILQDATFFNSKAFALTIVACAVVWTVAMVITMTRTRILYVEPGSGPGQLP